MGDMKKRWGTDCRISVESTRETPSSLQRPSRLSLDGGGGRGGGGLLTLLKASNTLLQLLDR